MMRAALFMFTLGCCRGAVDATLCAGLDCDVDQHESALHLLQRTSKKHTQPKAFTSVGEDRQTNRSNMREPLGSGQRMLPNAKTSSASEGGQQALHVPNVHVGLRLAFTPGGPEGLSQASTAHSWGPDDEPSSSSDSSGGSSSPTPSPSPTPEPSEIPTKAIYKGFTDESYLSRLEDSSSWWVPGGLLLAFSVPVLWMNEKRSAMYETLIARGAADCRTVSADKADPKNRDTLVHVQGEIKGAKPVEDSQFHVQFASGCLRLHTEVSVYQWVETESTQAKDTLGAGKEKNTTYTYHKEWSFPYGTYPYNDGSTFKGAQAPRNHKPDGLEVGLHTKMCDRIELGGGFLLDPGRYGLAEMACFGRDRVHDEGPEVKFKKNASLLFKKGEHEYYFTGHPDRPEIGDTRVQFKVVSDMQGTVVGLQVEKEAGRDTFLPYRLIRRPFCPCYDLDEEQEKQALHIEGKKTLEELSAEHNDCGICNWLCCYNCWDIVNTCCMGLMAPEIYRAVHGVCPLATCFGSIKGRSDLFKWLFRVVGFLLMFIGLVLIFAPIPKFISVIPFLGPLLASLGGFILWTFSFIVTALISIVIIALAYSAYNPLWGMLYLVIAAAIVVAIMLLSPGKDHGHH